MDRTASYLLLIVVLVGLAAATVWHIPLLELPGLILVGLIGWVLSVVTTGAGWVSGIVGPAFAAGLAAGMAGAFAVPPVLISVAGVLTVTIGSVATVAAVRPVIKATRKHPFEAISPTLSVMSIFVADSLAKAASIPSPQAEIVAVMNGLLFIGGGILIQRSQVGATVAAVLLFLIVPVYAVTRLLATRSMTDLVAAAAAMGVSTWLSLAVLLGMAVACGILAWVTRDGAGQPDALEARRA
jgi:hypothetical protein